MISHGFMSSVDPWVIPMAEALSAYPALILKDTACYEIYFELTSSGYVPRQKHLAGGNPTNVNSGEIFIKLDWSQMAGELGLFSSVTYRTTDVAARVLPALLSTNFIPELRGHPLVELPLHLIGHSRGGSLMCEIAHQLGQRGIWVDHLTTLDPHPLNNEYDDSIVTSLVDAPAVPWGNVVFADNYYQVNGSFLGNDPSGQRVPGAYNRYLNDHDGGYSGFFTAVHHSNVHLWYHGTIDWRTPASDTQASIAKFERTNWWTAAENTGQTAGMYYSLLGRGDRTSTNAPSGGTNIIRLGFNQLYDLGAGIEAPNRRPLEKNAGVWPNLMTFNLTGTGFMTEDVKSIYLNSDEELPVKVRYQAGQAGISLSISVFVDRDFNPYNGNEIQIDSVPAGISGTNNVFVGTRRLPGAGMLPAVYAVFAKISDGERSRYLYAPEFLVVEPSQKPPELTMRLSDQSSVTLTVNGSPGQSIVVEGGATLGEWQALATNTLTTSIWGLKGNISKSSRFYRAVLKH